MQLLINHRKYSTKFTAAFVPWQALLVKLSLSVKPSKV